jgi:hypothetical protein
MLSLIILVSLGLWSFGIIYPNTADGLNNIVLVIALLTVLTRGIQKFRNGWKKNLPL